MEVLILVNAPDGLKGWIGRFYSEMHPSVFIGTVSKRVQDSIWKKVSESLPTSAYAAYFRSRSNTPQGFTVAYVGEVHHTKFVDEDGLMLLMMKNDKRVLDSSESPQRKSGWSNASRYRQAKRFGTRRQN